MTAQETKAFEDLCKENDELKQKLKDVYYWASDKDNGLLMIQQIVKLSRHLL